MLPEVKRKNMLLLSTLLDYFLKEGEEAVKVSLEEEGRVFMQGQLEDYRYKAKFELLIISNLDMDVSVKVEYQAGEETGTSYSLTIKKRGEFYLPTLHDAQDAENSNVFNIDQLLINFQHHQQKGMYDLMSQLNRTEEENEVKALFSSEADKVLSQTYIDYCLDNRRFDLLEAFMKENKNVSV